MKQEFSMGINADTGEYGLYINGDFPDNAAGVILGSDNRLVVMDAEDTNNYIEKHRDELMCEQLGKTEYLVFFKKECYIKTADEKYFVDNALVIKIPSNDNGAITPDDISVVLTLFIERISTVVLGSKCVAAIRVS